MYSPTLTVHRDGDRPPQEALPPITVRLIFGEGDKQIPPKNGA